MRDAFRTLLLSPLEWWDAQTHDAKRPWTDVASSLRSTLKETGLSEVELMRYGRHLREGRVEALQSRIDDSRSEATEQAWSEPLVLQSGDVWVFGARYLPYELHRDGRHDLLYLRVEGMEHAPPREVYGELTRLEREHPDLFANVSAMSAVTLSQGEDGQPELEIQTPTTFDRHDSAYRVLTRLEALERELARYAKELDALERNPRHFPDAERAAIYYENLDIRLDFLERGVEAIERDIALKFSVTDVPYETARETDGKTYVRLDMERDGAPLSVWVHFDEMRHIPSSCMLDALDEIDFERSYAHVYEVIGDGQSVDLGSVHFSATLWDTIDAERANLFGYERAFSSESENVLQ